MDFLLFWPQWLQILVLFSSLIGLWWGSERVIAGATSLSRRIGVSELVIGLTIVSIGSSMPEIIVGIRSGAQGYADVALGNIIGSCLIQISLILGVCAFFGGGMQTSRQNLLKDGSGVLIALVLLWVFVMNGYLAVWESLVLMLLYIAFVAYFISQGESRFRVPSVSWSRALTLVVFGMLAVWASAESLMSLGLFYGRSAGLNEGFLGLLSGVGTSLPELVISLTALLHHKTGLSLGNLLGSNITDPLFSLSLGALVGGGYAVSSYLIWSAFPVWFGATALTLALFWFRGGVTKVSSLALVGYYLLAFFFIL